MFDYRGVVINTRMKNGENGDDLPYPTSHLFFMDLDMFVLVIHSTKMRIIPNQPQPMRI